jgi:hypothetical protein
MRYPVQGILFWYLWQLYEQQWLDASSLTMETQIQTHACLLIFHGLSCYKADFLHVFQISPVSSCTNAVYTSTIIADV